MALPSLRAVLSGVAPPREGRSSLLQEIGLMPIRIAGMAAPFIVFYIPLKIAPVVVKAWCLQTVTRRTPSVNQADKRRLHLLDQRFVIDFTGHPGPAGFLENRPADRKATAGPAPAGLLETLRQGRRRRIQAQQHHASAIRIALLNQGIELFPFGGALRFDLPPGRVDIQVVEALEGAIEHIGVGRWMILGWDDFQQQFMAAD